MGYIGGTYFFLVEETLNDRMSPFRGLCQLHLFIWFVLYWAVIKFSKIRERVRRLQSIWSANTPKNNITRTTFSAPNLYIFLSQARNLFFMVCCVLLNIILVFVYVIVYKSRLLTFLFVSFCILSWLDHL